MGPPYCSCGFIHLHHVIYIYLTETYLMEVFICCWLLINNKSQKVIRMTATLCFVFLTMGRCSWLPVNCVTFSEVTSSVCKICKSSRILQEWVICVELMASELQLYFLCLTDKSTSYAANGLQKIKLRWVMSVKVREWRSERFCGRAAASRARDAPTDTLTSLIFTQNEKCKR